MGHIAEAEVELGRIFAQRLVRSPYLKSWDASWPGSGRGIAELRSARKYGGLNQRYFDSTSPPIEPRCTAADCAEVGLQRVSGQTWQTSARALQRQTSPSTIFSARWEACTCSYGKLDVFR